MERKFSVRYKPATSGIHQEGEKRAVNTEHYDRDTDFNIFALGDAAQDAGMETGFGMGQLDEIFKDFGFTLDENLQPQFVTNTTRTTHKVTPLSTLQVPTPQATPAPAEDQHQAELGSTSFREEHDQNKGVQLSTITKTLPDGRTVQTKIFRGPVQTRKRIIKINRELPNGETELLGTYEAGAGETIDLPGAISSALSQSMGTMPQSSPAKDNLPPFPTDTSPSTMTRPAPEPFTADTFLRSSENLPYVDGCPSPSHEPRGTAHLPQPSVPGGTPKGIPRQNSMPIPASVTPLPKSPLKKSNSFFHASAHGSLPGSPNHLSRISDDYVIQPYFPHEGGILHDIDEEEISMCPAWCPSIWTRKKTRFNKSASDFFKGRFGMTASEVNTDDKALPGLQALVANYARMLYDEKAKFIQTLFRAVKLNKLDVLKILIRIVQKSGMKLSSKEIREPESSATILHVALLYNHEAVVDFLLANGDTDLIMAKYENEEYRNQTGLHVAVANGNPTIVEKLLMSLDAEQKQILINTIADGKYFRQQHPHGQLCLTAAAWAGNGEIISILVYHGGNLAIKNLRGDTLLHSIILQSATYPNHHDYKQLLMSVWDATGIWAEQLVYDTRNIHQRKMEQTQMQINLFKELLAIRNNDGYTPLALAATVTSKLFTVLIDFEKIYKIPQNKLGSITWVTYDVTDMSSFAYNNYNKFSVLHILAHNSQRLARHANLDPSEKEEDFLDIELMKTLLESKWQVYRWVYIAWLVIHLSYIILFTACTVEANTCPNCYFINETHVGIVQVSKVQYGMAFFLILPILYIILEILDLFGNKPYRIQFMSGQNYLIRMMKCVKSEWTITGNGPYRLVNLFFSFFIIHWFFLYIYKHPDQDISLAMALLLGWVFVLFFTRGCRVTCRFSIMIQKMFFRDLIYFLTVYGIILIGFSFAMNSMFTHMHDPDSTISEVFYDMMNVVTDLDKKQTSIKARQQLFAKLLLIFYAIVAVILLMNMLIAMMNTSYETVRVTKCNLWKQQQLSIMLMMERRLFWWKWLCLKSEQDIWRKTCDDEIRCFLDVTCLHTPSYKANSKGHK